MADVELYRPSNGTEGEVFMSQWCAQCVRDKAHREDFEEDGCEIIAMTMAVDVDDPAYPQQWRKDGGAGPRCTAFEEEDGPERVHVHPDQLGLL